MATEAEVLESSRKYAEKMGFKLNPNQQIVDAVVKGLVNNEKKHGVRYCPCRMISGDKEKDRKNICPCIYHKDEIKEQGYCHCMLFFRKD